MQLFAAIKEGWGELFERNAVYLRRRTTQSMKDALIGILFLLFSGWWGSGEEEYVRVEELQQEGMERVEAGKMDRQEEKVVRVLAEANRYAEVAVFL